MHRGGEYEREAREEIEYISISYRSEYEARESTHTACTTKYI